MARLARLTTCSVRGRASLRLLLALAIALVAHTVALDWLARQRAAVTGLRPMPAPMFTRLLQPQTPSVRPILEGKRPAARTRRAQPAINSIAMIPSDPLSASSTAEIAPMDSQPAQPTATAQALDPGAVASASATTATTTASALDGWPSDTRLNYKLSGQFRSGELYGGARVQWQREGSRYQVRIDIDVTLLASLVLTSQGEVTPDALLPQAYEETQRGRNRTARLGQDTIVLSNGRTVPRPQGVQDTASQFVELSHRFASGRDVLEVGRAVSFWMARPGAVDLWTYDIVEEELLKTRRLGDIAAFRLKPRPIANPRGNITAEMWFAPSLQYLPVRIRVSMGEGTYVDLLVDTIEQR
jgi:hypothetical protein